jgi:predicted carbohydrate-binding protein with CBM5 and CBM33 domain
MMIFLKFIQGTDGIHREAYRHNLPFDAFHGLGKTEEELLHEGVFISEDSIPTPEQNGKEAILCRNSDNGELFYEYADISLPESQRIMQLEQKNAQLEVHIQTAKADTIVALEATAQLYEIMIANGLTV